MLYNAEHNPRQRIPRWLQSRRQAANALWRLRLFILITSAAIFIICLLAINQTDLNLTYTLNAKYLGKNLKTNSRLIPQPAGPNLGKLKSFTDETSVGSPFRVAVILLCHNRPDYLKKTLDSLSTLWPSTNTISNAHFSLFISQDGNDNKVAAVIKRFKESFRAEHTHFTYDSNAWQSKYSNPFNPNLAVYYRISAHYQYILSRILSKSVKYSHLLFVEDDMLFAPDFFYYFAAAAEYLMKYQSVLCASAWNDNGQEHFVSDPGVLLRTDVFPGLGWMISRDVALELLVKWPAGFWDDWLREPEQRKERSCIFPEINRAKTFGIEGSSKGEWFHQYLATIQLNNDFIDWVRQPNKMVSAFDKQAFDKNFWQQINSSTLISIDNLTQIPNSKNFNNNFSQSFRLEYRNEFEFRSIAEKINCMPDWKSGAPRASYRGISVLRIRNCRLFLVRGQ